MKKSISRIIGVIMLIVAIAFIIFALNHPEKSFLWSNTHKWKKHPLMDEMKRLAGAKTLNYESSPLRKDMPQ